MEKKLLSLALALVMALALLPVLPAARAANELGPGDVTFTDVDFGTIEKGSLKPSELNLHGYTTVTNHTDRPIYVQRFHSDNYQVPGGPSVREDIFPGIGEYINTGLYVGPGKSVTVGGISLNLGRVEEYPFSFHADYTATVAFGHFTGPLTTYTFSVTAKGSISETGPGSLSLSTNVLDFGKVNAEVGQAWWSFQAPEAQTVTVTNTSSAVIVLDDLANFSEYSSTFVYSHYTPSEVTYSLPGYGLQPGESATFTVQPRATSANNGFFNLPAGLLEETLTISATPASTSTPLTLRFELGGVAITPTETEGFGEVVEGAIPSRAITYTVRNTSDRIYELAQPYFGNDLWQLIIGPLSKTTLAPGDTATFDVTIRPTAKQGTYTGLITLRDTDGHYLGHISGNSVTVLAPGAVLPEEPEDPEKPEEPSSWAQADVSTAVSVNLVPAELQTKYTQTITRAEFCALATALYETVTGKTVTPDASFTDTSDPNILKMATLGVVNGVGSGKFNPDGQLTREQAAAMLSRLAEAAGRPLPEQMATFTDMSGVSSYAVGPVGKMQATGIMSGVGDNTFAPQNPYTREQSIITILRLFNAMK